MKPNAAGLDVAGAANPNWKGGKLNKLCRTCGGPFQVRRGRPEAAFCSMRCVGISQRGRPGIDGQAGMVRKRPKTIFKSCEVCSTEYAVFRSHAHRHHCCSKACSAKRRAPLSSGAKNPNWSGGLSRLPYPWNFREISKTIIQRDGHKCQNPDCAGTDPRLTAHHINYQKLDCRPENLITLCSACNSKANFGRERWQAFYSIIVSRETTGAE